MSAGTLNLRTGGRRSAHGLKPARREHWTDDAECAQPGNDPEWWSVLHSDGQGTMDNRVAVRICHRCPVRAECYEAAITAQEPLVGVILAGFFYRAGKWVEAVRRGAPRREIPPPPAVCERCATALSADRSPTQRFCGYNCQRAAYRARNLERQRLRRAEASRTDAAKGGQR